LPKLPPLGSADSGRDLWLQLFNAQTEEDLKKIEEMGVSVMSEAIRIKAQKKGLFAQPFFICSRKAFQFR